MSGKPELDDCAAASRAKGEPLAKVQRAAADALRASLAVGSKTPEGPEC